LLGKGLLAFGKVCVYTLERSLMLPNTWLRRIIRWAQRSPADWLYQHGPRATLSLPLSWPLFIIGFIFLDVLYTQAPLLPLVSPLARIIQFLVFLAFFLLLLTIILRWQRLNLRVIGLLTSHWIREALIGLTVSILFILVIMINNSVAGSPPLLDWISTLSSSQRAWWILELATRAIVAGIIEETIFRGWVTTFLLTRLTRRELALWISAVIFGLAHFGQGLKGIAITTVFGYCWGLLYIWRKNLTPTIVVHTLYNFCLWLGLLGRFLQ
jgi:membrane protease YdiL (CAAX protease family)